MESIVLLLQFMLTKLKDQIPDGDRSRELVNQLLGAKVCPFIFLCSSSFSSSSFPSLTLLCLLLLLFPFSSSFFASSFFFASSSSSLLPPVPADVATVHSS